MDLYVILEIGCLVVVVIIIWDLPCTPFYN